MNGPDSKRHYNIFFTEVFYAIDVLNIFYRSLTPPLQSARSYSVAKRVDTLVLPPPVYHLP